MSNKTNPIDVRTDFDRYKERHQKTPTEPIHSTSLKVIIIGACVLVVAALVVIPVIISATRTRHLALPEKINKVTIYKEGTAGTTFSYTDSEKIGKLTDYLTSLKLKPAAGVNEKEGMILGGEWEIKMDSEGSVSGVNLFGNEFVQDPEGEWWVISAEEGHEFEELLRSQIPDELPQTLLFDEWAAASLASREKAQYFLDNADTVWFEEYPVIMHGHELIPTAKFTAPVLPDSPMPIPDPTEAMLGNLHSTDISGYDETDENADTREYIDSFGISAGDEKCRMILARNQGMNLDEAVDIILAFEFSDKSRIAFAVPDPTIDPVHHTQDDVMDDNYRNIFNTISMSKSGRLYARGDISGEMKIYDNDGNETLTASWISAYAKCIFEGTVLYGDTVSGDDAKWNRRVTFEDGSEYDVDAEKLYIRPYADGAPGDKIYAIGGFEEMEGSDMIPIRLQAILGYEAS